MGTTPNRQLPYPELVDQANVPDDMQELALALDTALYDTGWINGGTGATVAVADPTSFTLTGSFIRRVGNVVSVQVTGTLKVALTVAATGDIANTNLAQLAAAYRPAGAPTQALGPANLGRGLLCYVQPTGWITATAATGTTNMAIGEAVSVAGTYVL